jgi:ABC-type sugar transport system substrate-binding protein
MKLPCLFLSISLLLVVAFTGCSRTQEGPPRKKIAGMVFQEDQFFRLVLFGMRDAAAKNGVEFLEANSVGRPDKEIQLINTYIGSGVDAILVSPLSARASMSALQRAKDKGITVVTYNTTVEGDAPVAYVESDQTGLGSMTGQAARAYIETRLNGKADIAILAFASNAPEQSAMRVGGFKSEVLKLPGVRIVAEQDAWMAETAVKKAGDILTAHPSVTILWAANEGGKQGRVAVFGTDASEQLASFLLADDNILQAVTGQRPFEIGSMAVMSAIKAMKGEPVEKKVSLPGLHLARNDTAAVHAYTRRLHELTK